MDVVREDKLIGRTVPKEPQVMYGSAVSDECIAEHSVEQLHAVVNSGQRDRAMFNPRSLRHAWNSGRDSERLSILNRPERTVFWP